MKALNKQNFLLSLWLLMLNNVFSIHTLFVFWGEMGDSSDREVGESMTPPKE